MAGRGGWGGGGSVCDVANRGGIPSHTTGFLKYSYSHFSLSKDPHNICKK